MNENKKKICLDLCAGLGGFSQAFLNDKKWDVITLDIEKKFNPTIEGDVIDIVEHPEKYKDFWELKPDIIMASPPCNHFSLANPTWPRQGIYTALKIAGACMEIIARLQPKYFILENPHARLRYFMRNNVNIRLNSFGYRTVKPTDFWTNIEFFGYAQGGKYNTNQTRKNGRSRYFDTIRSPEQRACMPYGLSEFIKKTIEKEI